MQGRRERAARRARGWVRRALWLLGLGILPTLGCLVWNPRANPTGCSQPFDASGPIALEWPRSLMVVQQSAGGAALRVSGRLIGVAPGPVLARYRGGAWLRIEVDPGSGAFDARLPEAPSGWGAVDVVLERDPRIGTTVTPVGVGNVVILAGQSNMVMKLATRSYTRRGATVLGRRRDPEDPQAIDWAVDPLHDCRDQTGSIWPALGDRLIRGTAGVPVMFVATSVGATGLVARGEWLPGGPRFESMLEEVRTATGGQMCAAALLWLQGETDARYGVPREAYADALVALAAGVEDAMSCFVPVVAGVIGRIEESPLVAAGDAEAIRQGTLDAIDASPNLYAGPWTFDLPIASLHFTDAAAESLLDRWCEAIAAAPAGLRCSP
jgi:Carbohydrate esterase, sialic acid-specific acetylesterase